MPPCVEAGSDKASGKLIKVGLANNVGAVGLQALHSLGHDRACRRRPDTPPLSQAVVFDGHRYAIKWQTTVRRSRKHSCVAHDSGPLAQANEDCGIIDLAGCAGTSYRSSPWVLRPGPMRGRAPDSSRPTPPLYAAPCPEDKGVAGSKPNRGE